MLAATPIIAPSGLTLSSLAFLWVFVLILATAVSLFLDSGRRDYYKSLPIVFALFIPWSLIFLIQLPDESQFLLAACVAFVGVLFYRWHYQKHKSEKTAHIEGIEEGQKKTEPQQVSITIFPQQGLGTPSALRKAMGVLLIMVDLFIFLIVFYAVLSNYSLFLSMLASLPVLLPSMVIASWAWKRTNLKGAVEAWIFLVIITLIPFALVFPAVLPLAYQIPYISLLVIAFVTFIYWLHLVRARNRPKRKMSTPQSVNP